MGKLNGLVGWNECEWADGTGWVCIIGVSLDELIARGSRRRFMWVHQPKQAVGSDEMIESGLDS